MNEPGGPMADDDGRPDQPDWPETLLVPDDPSALEADMLALRRERHAAARRERLHRLTGGDRFRAYGISVPVIVVGVALVAALGALLVLLAPSPSRTAPTAGAATASPGRGGGPLPAVPLREPDGATLTASALAGVAAFVLVPVGCGCTDTVHAVAVAAGRAGARTYVVEPTQALAQEVDAGADALVIGYADQDGRLLARYGATGTAPTVLLTDHIGDVRTVSTGVTAAGAAAVLSALPG